MRLENFRDRMPGKLVDSDGENERLAYIPAEVPNFSELDFSTKEVSLLAEAERNLGNLSGISRDLENPDLLLTPYLMRESVSSTRIEGTQTSLKEMLRAETERRKASRNIKEVENYQNALRQGLKEVEDNNITLELIKSLHRILFEGIEDVEGTPGKFRETQNYVGPDYTPPPPDQVQKLMDDLIEFLYENRDMPDLVKLAIFHYQFEAIHPFADGNGRVGRILLVLYVQEMNILREPLLFMSDYFRRNRGQYFDKLFGVSATGDYESWIRFFLEGVIDQSEDALNRSNRLRDLSDQYKEKMKEITSSQNAVEAVKYLFENPVITASTLEKKVGVSNPTARRILDKMIEAGIIEETEERNPKKYVCSEVLSILEAEDVVQTYVGTRGSN